jgi:hypothetical protein
MAYIREKMDGTPLVQPHKLRVLLQKKISELLTKYTLDEVLGEIAQQRPSFDIRCVTNPKPTPITASSEKEVVA